MYFYTDLSNSKTLPCDILFRVLKRFASHLSKPALHRRAKFLVACLFQIFWPYSKRITPQALTQLRREQSISHAWLRNSTKAKHSLYSCRPQEYELLYRTDALALVLTQMW